MGYAWKLRPALPFAASVGKARKANPAAKGKEPFGDPRGDGTIVEGSMEFLLRSHSELLRSKRSTAPEPPRSSHITVETPNIIPVCLHQVFLAIMQVDRQHRDFSP